MVKCNIHFVRIMNVMKLSNKTSKALPEQGLVNIRELGHKAITCDEKSFTLQYRQKIYLLVEGPIPKG